MNLLEQHLVQLHTWNYPISIAATVAFAITGVIAITQRSDTDLVGAIVFGTITGFGGGTIRDVILGIPPSWSQDQSYVAITVVASVLAFYLARPIRQHGVLTVLTYLDGLGAALYAIQATSMVWLSGFARPTGPILLGVITAIGGGLIRDVLAGQPTLLVRRELYATPLLLGCVASSLCLWLAPAAWAWTSVLCVLGTFAFRAAAIHWRLRLPWWASIHEGRVSRPRHHVSS